MTKTTRQNPASPTPLASHSLRFAHLAPLAGASAFVLLIALLMPTLLEPISEYPSYFTQHDNALTMVAVTLAALLSLAAPIWPLRTEERDFQRRDYWRRLPERVAEPAMVLATGIPFLLAAAVFSGHSMWRIAEVFTGLLGTVMVAAAWRTALTGGYRWLRRFAQLDLLVTTLGPIVLGYLLLEGRGLDIGWLWRLSPLSIAADLARSGLQPTSAAFIIGTPVYMAVSLLLLLLMLPPIMRPRL